LLLVARDEGLVSDSEVRHEVVTLIVAGHETVAATLTWTWWLVAAHSKVEEQLHEEVDSLPDPPWDSTVMDQLPYARAVVNECLRLYPPAWVITRRSLAPDVLDGYQIPTGSTIIMSPYLMHRDPALWTRPQEFDPGRFLPGIGHAVDEPAYLPFGTGPRLCIGRDLALLEAPLIVARLARQFVVRPVGPAVVTNDFGVTLRPAKALRVTVGLR
jgi:cytochrome P450